MVSLKDFKQSHLCTKIRFEKVICYERRLSKSSITPNMCWRHLGVRWTLSYKCYIVVRRHKLARRAGRIRTSSVKDCCRLHWNIIRESSYIQPMYSFVPEYMDPWDEQAKHSEKDGLWGFLIRLLYESILMHFILHSRCEHRETAGRCPWGLESWR